MIPHFIIKSRIFFLYFFYASIIFLSTSLQAQYNLKIIDSLETRLNTQSLSNDELFDTFQALIEANKYTNSEKALEYVRKGFDLAVKNKNDYYLAKSYFNAGDVYYELSILDSALYYFEKSLAIHTQADKKRNEIKAKLDFLLIDIFIGFAKINYHNGKYDLALNDFMKALDLAEKINHLEKIAEAYYSMGETYSSVYNNRQAEVYFEKAEQIYKEMNDSVGIADMYMRLSYVYFVNSEHQKGLEYAEESYRILSSHPNPPIEILYSSVSRLCDVWLMFHDYNKALEYSLKSVELAGQTNMPRLLAMSLYQLSKCYFCLDKYKEADETAFRALETDSNDLYTNSNLYGIIAQSNIFLKNSEKAYEYHKKSLKVFREYSNQNYQSSISEMEVKYETEKKEMQIAALKSEKRMMIWISIAGGGVLLLGLVAIFSLWRWTVQKRRLAESQIKQLEQEKQLVATQAVFDGEVQERSRLARDLHDGMGGKLTAMKIYLERFKQNFKFDKAEVEQFNSAMDMLDDSVQELRRVSHNLMPDTLSRSGLKPAIGDFCRSMSPIIVFNYYGDESRLDLKLEALIYRSIHELVNNALKYANASEIMVQITRDSDGISFTVQDDGCGFDATAMTEGMGLQSIRTRVASFGGDMQVDSDIGVGTEVNVELRIEN